MTAPRAADPARPAQAAFTAAELAVVLSKREHDQLHDDWQRHERRCPRCVFGARCRVADVLKDAADDAGKRWQLAEERERRSQAEPAGRVVRATDSESRSRL